MTRQDPTARSRVSRRASSRRLGRAASSALAGELAVGLAAARGPHAGRVEVDGAHGAAGRPDLETYVGRVTGTGSHSVGVGGVDGSARRCRPRPRDGRRRRAPRSARRRPARRPTDARPARAGPSAGRRPARRRGRPAGAATHHQSMTPAVATATTARLARRSRSSTRRRRRAARGGLRGGAGRRSVTSASPWSPTSTWAAGRPGVTTSRALRRLTGSRRASTRIGAENRSTDRLRTTSSWCLSALGIR